MTVYADARTGVVFHFPDETAATFGLPNGSFTSAAGALCPDMLTIDEIGAADNLRGWVVRVFFRLMRCWPPR